MFNSTRVCKLAGDQIKWINRQTCLFLVIRLMPKPNRKRLLLPTEHFEPPSSLARVSF